MLSIGGTGFSISSVTMASAGSASSTTTVATGFSHTAPSGNSFMMTGPNIAMGSTSNTQPWVKVDVVFTTAGSVVTLAANSILFTDLGGTNSNNGSVADFSLAKVVPEYSDWRITAGFCVFCVAMRSAAKRWRISRRPILKSDG
jgi:hypothetical protein